MHSPAGSACQWAYHNAAAARTAIRGRFVCASEIRCRKKIEHAGADGGPIQISVAEMLRSRRAERRAREEAVALLAAAVSEPSEPETSEPAGSKAA
jgi:hypothetical protein